MVDARRILRAIVTRLVERSRPPLIPVVVGATGRSGTTLIMELLGSSNRVAFDRIYAFEHSYLAYLWQWAHLPEDGMVDGPDWRRASIDMEGWLGKHGKSGGVPWPDRPSLEGRGRVPFAHEVLRAVWPVFSRRAAAHHRARTRRRPTHYAETTPPWLVQPLLDVLGGHGLYLVRDPRDQYLSMLAFIEKTGQLSFGYQPHDTPETFAKRHASRQLDLLRLVAAARDGGSPHVVRYEDLVSDLDGEAARLGARLGVELDPAAVRRQQEIHERHRTSTGSSVGRWRTELDPEIAAIFDDMLGADLVAAGYDR